VIPLLRRLGLYNTVSEVSPTFYEALSISDKGHNSARCLRTISWLYFYMKNFYMKNNNKSNQVLDPVCEACLQQFANSQFLANLNRDGDTLPGIDYLAIVSK